MHFCILRSLYLTPRNEEFCFGSKTFFWSKKIVRFLQALPSVWKTIVSSRSSGVLIQYPWYGEYFSLHQSELSILQRQYLNYIIIFSMHCVWSVRIPLRQPRFHGFHYVVLFNHPLRNSFHMRQTQRSFFIRNGFRHRYIL